MRCVLSYFATVATSALPARQGPFPPLHSSLLIKTATRPSAGGRRRSPFCTFPCLLEPVRLADCNSEGFLRFVENAIGELLLSKIALARHVRIATAFFSPSQTVLTELNRTSRLDLLISEEFAINDPYKLEQLKNADVRSVPTDDLNGKLHAKVFIAALKNGSTWALVGSANLTQQGLFANQEACIELDSGEAAQAAEILRMTQWFDTRFARARPTDLTAAKEIFDNRSRYRLVVRSPSDITISIEHWAIKTTSGGADAEEHWPRLLKESVVAIGWEELDVDPSKVSDAQLRHSLARILDPKKPGSVNFGLRTIRNFIAMPIDSIVVLCRGLVPNQTKPVHIYAFARVTGSFRADPQDGSKWRFKRSAVIQEIGMALPASTFAQAVAKDSFRQTMHQISPEVVQRLARELGAPIEV